MDDVIIAKAATIERCLIRIQYEATHDWKTDFTHQDALLLNLERACQATIDAAAHVIRIKKLGLPKQSREVFDQLEEHQIIDKELALGLKNMVGFRNIAVHDYASINLEVVAAILNEKLDDLQKFAQVLLQLD